MIRRVLALGVLAAAAACALPPKRCERPPEAVESLSPALAEAKQAAYNKDYELALRKTAEVIKLRDPDEAMALTIRCSTYYLMDKKCKAKRAWKRAYGIDPCLKDIPAMLERLEHPPRPAK